jgi:site-specific recombinase XerD
VDELTRRGVPEHLRRDKPRRTVQDLLGHKDVITTLI